MVSEKKNLERLQHISTIDSTSKLSKKHSSLSGTSDKSNKSNRRLHSKVGKCHSSSSSGSGGGNCEGNSRLYDNNTRKRGKYKNTTLKQNFNMSSVLNENSESMHDIDGTDVDDYKYKRYSFLIK
eukprot:Pgem_evm1s15960